MTAPSLVQPRTGTFSAMRNTNFRLYFVGQLISISGTWMQNLAQGFLVFKITQSEAWLGIVACAAGLPVLLLAPVAGVIVERVPRRRLLFFTQTAQMLLAFVLFGLTVTAQVQVWHIVVLAALLGATNALYEPARQIFVVEVVGLDDLSSGITVNSIMNNTSRIVGPMAAGLALVQVGAAWCFFLNGLSFLAVLVMLYLVKVPYAIRHATGSAPLKQMREGFRFARSHEQIMPLLLMVTIAGIFVVPIANMLPAFADVVLHSPDQGYAALSAGQGIGAVIVGLTMSWLAFRYGYGRLIAAAAVLGAAATILLAAQTTIPASMIAAGLAAAASTVLFIGINTMIQMAVPDAFRGRVLSLYTLSFLALAPFGALALGVLANVIGTSTALALWGARGGLLGGAVVLRWPSLVGREGLRSND